MGTLSVYLDTSVVVALFSIDAFAARASTFLRTQSPVVLISDFVGAEFASAIGRRVRMKELTLEQGRRAFTNFDNWTGTATSRIETTSADIRAAETILRRLDLTPRTPDAINIALARRIGAELATFDAKMAENARALGMILAPV